MTVFERYQCWHQDRTDEVINKEAVAVSLADFMATHAPLGQITDRRGRGAPRSEADLLDDLLRAGQSDHHTFAIIQGIPGTGKSHLIRWLYERYLSVNGRQDEVLLIERAQNSLLGTLRQIIDKLGIVDASLRQQIDKLRGAAERLSQQALAESILNNLAIASSELDEPTKPRIRKSIKAFLHDTVIRSLLSGDGGPADRIAQFLSAGRRRAESDDGRPEFQPEDFAIKVETMRAMRGQAYREALDLAESLNTNEDLRPELANYLNRLLDYAISMTATISAEDLRETFNDLRRELRRRGKGLALFIEDITAFTGIDIGLIDVLATQHTGEANREFCRIISVVGITDGYFIRRFPDNMRERVTHHLSLNAGSTDRPEAGLLATPMAAADLAARYLNAMRVDSAGIQQWYEQGGRVERLPNRCDNCPYRLECHEAFGSVNIGERDTAPVEIGLYPFNSSAIWKIYERLDEATIARTPRSLLSYVLLDVLQSHGTRVAAGSFPPPAKELAPGVHNIPPLAKPVQQRVINEQGGADAPRVQSLVLYWGDGTVDARGEGEVSTVGSLRPAVFRAFAVRAILGEPVNVSPVPRPPVDVDTSNVPPQPSPQPERKGTKYDADIAKWRDGGKLDQHEKLRGYLVRFVKTAIDWTSHGVSASLVDERITVRRFEIVGQSGAIKGDRLTFERNDPHADVLQALADMNEVVGSIVPSTLGAHLTTLSSWLSRTEAAIVDFARRPTSEHPATVSLTELLIADCLLLAWLGDELKVEGTSTQELLRTVVKSAGTELAARPLGEGGWLSMIERARAVHGKAWAELLKSIRYPRATTCKKELLRQLNLPQGRSTEVRFLDAATALDCLGKLSRDSWELPSVPVIESNYAVDAWRDGSVVHGLLRERFDTVIQEDIEYQRELRARFSELIGGAEPDEAIKAMEALLASLREHNVTHSLSEPPLKGPGLRRAVEYVDRTLDSQGRFDIAVRLSAGTRQVESLATIISYMRSVIVLAERTRDNRQRQIEQLQANSEVIQLEAEVMQLYDETIAALREPAPALADEEVQP